MKPGRLGGVRRQGILEHILVWLLQSLLTIIVALLLWILKWIWYCAEEAAHIDPNWRDKRH